MRSLDEIVGENIRGRRDALGLTQKDLALASKLTPQSLNKIEKGKRQARSTNLALIAQALGCSKEDLRQTDYSLPTKTKEFLELVAKIKTGDRTLENIIDWIRRLTSTDKHDLAAIAARAWLTGDASEARQLNLKIDLDAVDHLFLKKAKNE